MSGDKDEESEGVESGVCESFSSLFVQEQDESAKQREKTSVKAVKTRRNFFIKNNSFSIKIDIHQYFNIKKIKNQQKSQINNAHSGMNARNDFV